MFFIKLLNKKDIDFCLKGIKEVSYVDGAKTQPVNKFYKIKQNLSP